LAQEHLKMIAQLSRFVMGNTFWTCPRACDSSSTCPNAAEARLPRFPISKASSLKYHVEHDDASSWGDSIEWPTESSADTAGDSELCVICFEHPANVTVEPCGHSQFCGTCIARLTRCPLCCQELRISPQEDSRRRLLNEGLTVVNDYGQTAIHEAASKGMIEIVEQYLNSGVNVDVLTDCLSTPLHLAAANGHCEVAAYLLSVGASVHIADSSGSTPLHSATMYGYSAMAQLLLAWGANVNARDKQDMTPLHWAARMSQEGIALALLTAGADLNATSGHGYTPFAMAQDWGTAATGDLLEAWGGTR